MSLVSAERSPRRPPVRGITLRPRDAALSLLGTALLFVPGVLSFGPVLGGRDGYLASGGGVVLGASVAVLARWRRWSLASVLAALAAVYLAFGGALALGKTTIGGVLPTLDTLTRLVPLSVQSWRDLLTVAVPADSFVGPAVMPYLSGLVLGAVAGWLTLHERRFLWTLLPALTLLVLGILWGLSDAPLAAPLGAGFGVVGLLWAAWRSAVAAGAAPDQVSVVGGSHGVRVGRVVGAVCLALATAGSAWSGAGLLSGGAPRYVLRDVVLPPLNLAQYASPLTSYRYLELDQKDVTLFTVTGLAPGDRIRLATLDAYDGHVYNVADASAGFVRIGDRIAAGASRRPVTLDIAIDQYSGVWLPGGGSIRGLRFAGERAQAQAESLYFNAYGGTALTTAGVAQGTRYSVDLVRPTVVNADAPEAAIASTAEPANERVPDSVAKVATSLAGDERTPLAQLRRIETQLKTTGYYSNGADGKSRSGHSSERIAAMLAAPQLVGDDEQYAVAMALMARQLGVPARVVMGFYADPPATGPLEVKGSMAHVWVEVPLAGDGWAVFDPTPDRSRVPQTLVPKPSPMPKPQVLPPPDPPVNRGTDPQDVAGQKPDDADRPGEDVLRRVLMIGAAVVAGCLVVGAPFAVIGAVKRRRTRLRREASNTADRISGAWAEVVDAATDAGVRVPVGGTRLETAPILAAGQPVLPAVRLAQLADAGVFGPALPSQAYADRVWHEVDSALQRMRQQLSRWGRVRAACSLRSFAGGRRHFTLSWKNRAQREGDAPKETR